MPAAYREARILLERDLAKRKPFNEGKGMRDALLWECVLELCASSPRPLAVISTNTRDFADSRAGVLHEDLLVDLDRIGLPRESAEFYPSIEAFLRKRSRGHDEGSAGSDGGAADGPSTEPSEPPRGEFEPTEERPTRKTEPPTGHSADSTQPQVTERPEFTEYDAYVLANHVSDERRSAFLKSFVSDRRTTAVTEFLFGRANSLLPGDRASGSDHATGFNTLYFKGPFVEGSNWMPANTWDFAVSLELHLLGRLEVALQDAAAGRLGQDVYRSADAVLTAIDAMVSECVSLGYYPSLIVLSGELGLQLYVDLEKQIVGSWHDQFKREFATEFRLVGSYRGLPILDIPQSDVPSVYVVDLGAFGRLIKHSDAPDFALEEFDEERAKQLLCENPALISNPAPDSGLDADRVKQLQLRVGLRLYETYEIQVDDPNSVIARPLVGPVVD